MDRGYTRVVSNQFRNAGESLSMAAWPLYTLLTGNRHSSSHCCRLRLGQDGHERMTVGPSKVYSMCSLQVVVGRTCHASTARPRPCGGVSSAWARQVSGSASGDHRWLKRCHHRPLAGQWTFMSARSSLSRPHRTARSTLPHPSAAHDMGRAIHYRWEETIVRKRLWWRM